MEMEFNKNCLYIHPPQKKNVKFKKLKNIIPMKEKYVI
jgi:hypothetical protein